MTDGCLASGCFYPLFEWKGGRQFLISKAFGLRWTAVATFWGQFVFSCRSRCPSQISFFALRVLQNCIRRKQWKMFAIQLRFEILLLVFLFAPVSLSNIWDIGTWTSNFISNHSLSLWIVNVNVWFVVLTPWSFGGFFFELLMIISRAVKLLLRKQGNFYQIFEKILFQSVTFTRLGKRQWGV